MKILRVAPINKKTSVNSRAKVLEKEPEKTKAPISIFGFFKSGRSFDELSKEDDEFEVPVEPKPKIMKREKVVAVKRKEVLKKTYKREIFPKPLVRVVKSQRKMIEPKDETETESKTEAAKAKTVKATRVKAKTLGHLKSKVVDVPNTNTKATTKGSKVKQESLIPKPQEIQPPASSTTVRLSARIRSLSNEASKVTSPSKPLKQEAKVTKKPVVGRSSRPVRKLKKSDDNYDDGDEFEIEISESELGNESDYDYDSEAEAQAAKKKKKTKIDKKSSKKKKNRKKSSSDSRWDRIKQILASGGTVEALPGRVDEFEWIKRTVVGLLESSLGGCLYISGVPGTGKTATTHRTLDALSLAALKGECRDFDFVEINGMRLSDPGQAYSILAKTIFKGEGRIPSTGALALQKLESHFKARQKSKTTGRPCVVLLDELDLLLRKKQSILYHFFEWPNWTNSQLIVITIANTMDLPERFLSNRISSRLGLTRYNFKPYDHAALANIIEHQLKDYVKYLGKDAIQLCARKVSAVSGDARRAVNLAKRAVDYFRSCSQEELLQRMTGKIVEKVPEGSEMSVVNLRLMDIILKEALQANPVEIIGHLAKQQRVLLLSIILARKRLEEEVSIKGGTKIIGQSSSNSRANGILTVNRVLEQHFQLCRTHQYHPLPSLQELYCLLESLESMRLLRCVKFRESGPEAVVQLLVHEEDIRKGLGDDQALKKYIRE